MKYIKKYESFGSDIAMTTAGVFGVLGLLKLGISYISNKRDKDLVFYILRNLPTTGNSSYTVQTVNNIMTLTQKTTTSEKNIITLNLLTRELSYYIDVEFEQTISIKISKSDFEKIKVSLKFIDDVNKEVDMCFQEAKDYDYEIRIYDYDFLKKTFKVELSTKDSSLLDTSIVFDSLNRFLLMCEIELVDKTDSNYISKVEDSDDFIIHAQSPRKVFMSFKSK